MKTLRVFVPAFLTLFLLPLSALASGSGHGLDGSELSIFWVIPFVCLLLSIAICPLTVPEFWEHHFGKVALFWGFAFLVPCAIVFGPSMAFGQLIHVCLSEYLPFIILLLALFTVAGGICLAGKLVGTPKVNTLILLIGTILASWMGTTGAAMLLIRPLLRANAHRRFRTHQVIFFIFLVANIGGSLSPLGDPPLFLGFLKGVSFFWTTTHLFFKTFLLAAILLTVFYLLDSHLYKKEGSPVIDEDEQIRLPHGPGTWKLTEGLVLEGTGNIKMLLGIILTVLLSGIWQPGISFDVVGTEVELQNLCRDLLLLCITFVSWQYIDRNPNNPDMDRHARKANGFTWFPIMEVGKLFIGIFVSMVPAIAILRAGEHGALAPVVSMVFFEGEPVNAAFFWLSGLLSSFLDNAPTYLVFFNTATGDAVHLMGEWANTLAAISAGSVFMGAITYIGNAPNFMVRSIAAERKVPMPSFFGYMVWSIGILYPCFALLTFIFF